MYWSISDNGEGVKRRRIQQKFPKLSLDTIATGENSGVLPLACGSLSVLLVRVCSPWRAVLSACCWCGCAPPSVRFSQRVAGAGVLA